MAKSNEFSFPLRKQPKSSKTKIGSRLLLHAQQPRVKLSAFLKVRHNQRHVVNRINAKIRFGFGRHNDSPGVNEPEL